MTTATAKRSGITIERTAAGVVAAGAIITGVGARAGLASAAVSAGLGVRPQVAVATRLSDPND
ncbi:hypothetical protein EF294_11350 [Gordonia oryzae]|uniref:Uncharacterized protein n=1 Tax=Gordonia oryzae TaxID=2487349 RepID=A0A3N4GKU5_9ACTN|nr:hypothetical protein [Gordonia oryzae]RPA61206.1 hypothetical protein EF294_11350 [Gordonia oryzae]